MKHCNSGNASLGSRSTITHPRCECAWNSCFTWLTVGPSMQGGGSSSCLPTGQPRNSGLHFAWFLVSQPFLNIQGRSLSASMMTCRALTIRAPFSFQNFVQLSLHVTSMGTIVQAALPQLAAGPTQGASAHCIHEEQGP